MQDQLRLAGCVIRDREGKIYLLHRTKHNEWEVPGGKIDEIVDGKIVPSGATPEATAEREMDEELNAQVHIVRKLGEREFKDNGGYISHFSWYEAKIKGGAEPSIGEPYKYDGLKAFSKSQLHAMRGE